MKAQTGIRPGESEKTWLFLAAAVTLVLNVLSWRFPVFWDSILHSRISFWYFDTGFSSLKIPEDMDALHPPLFNLYIAGLWKMLGRELWVAHLAILPFSLGLIWQLFLLSKRFHAEAGIFILLLVLIEPCLLAQTMQVSPDICLIFFYVLGLNALLANRNRLLAFSMICMAMLHFRGVLMAPGVWMTGLLISERKISLKEILASLIPFLPAACMTLAFLVFHYKYAGWFFRPPMETYGTTRSLAPFSEMLRNIAVMAFRFLDNGKVFLFLPLSAFVLLSFLRKQALPAAIRYWLITGMIPALILGLAFIPFSIPLGHRYFLISFLALIAASAELLSRIKISWIKSAGMAGALLVLLSGHLWIYPDKISKGWDATLAHIPWYRYRKEAVQYIHQNQIDPSTICSDFPNLQPMLYSDLNGDSIRFKPKQENFGGCEFVFWSNVLNGFSDAELQELKSEWIPEKTWGAFPVKVILYRRPSFMADEADVPQHISIVAAHR